MGDFASDDAQSFDVNPLMIKLIGKVKRKNLLNGIIPLFVLFQSIILFCTTKSLVLKLTKE